jgi:Ribbon-helix-helix protein, copG family
MYTDNMKRLQIYIESEMDEALARDAARHGVSKAAIIRRLVAEHFGRSPEPDPIDALVGSFEGEAGDVDDVVYGR